MKISCTLLFLMFICIASAQTVRTRTAKLMGARFDFTIVAGDSAIAERYIDTSIAEVKRIEYLISDWIDTTQVSRINKFAGIRPVVVDKELIDLTTTALLFSKLTRGAFDISFAAMEKIWFFDGSMTTMPGRADVERAKAKVGFSKIIIDTIHSTIFLRDTGMKIGFGALGEGYAADRCRELMLKKGVTAGIVNGSGDMNTWGARPDGSPWKIGISDPFNKGSFYAVVPLKDGAVVTSGSYEKYAEINGKRYSHIINPATGYPATGLISVTVFGPSAEIANALSTSCMVLGRRRALRLIKRFTGYKCIIIADNGKVYTSRNFQIDQYRVKDDQ